MKHLLLITFIAVFLQACSKREVQVPSDILPRDKMIPVLTDVHLAEALIQLKNLGRNDSTKEVALGYYTRVFKKHNISREQYDRSFSFYVSQPEMMTVMYDSVITRLSTQNLAATHP